MTGSPVAFHSAFLEEPTPPPAPFKPNLSRPWLLIFSVILGPAYISLSWMQWTDLGCAVGVLVHVALLSMAAGQMTHGRLFSDPILQSATYIHTWMCWLHCLVALLIFSLRPQHHSVIGCSLHLTTCGGVLGVGKLAQLVFLFEKHFLANPNTSVFQTCIKRSSVFHAIFTRATTPQGILGLCISIPMCFFILMVFLRMEFRDDCVYLSAEPWKTGCFVCISLLTLLVIGLYLHMAYQKYWFASKHQWHMTKRLLIAAVACTVPTFLIDVYVLYVAASFPIAACLNCCAWYMMVGLQGMKYIACTTQTLGLQSATFVDSSTWEVLATCPSHQDLFNGPLVGSKFLDIVTKPDRAQLEALSTQENTHLLLLRCQPIEKMELKTVMACLHWLGDNLWRMHLEDVTDYATSTELHVQEYRDVLHGVRQPVAALDSEFKFRFVNNTWIDFMGYLNTAQAIGMPVTSVFPTIDPTTLSHCVSSEWQEVQVSRASGEQADVRMAIDKLVIGCKVMYIITLRSDTSDVASSADCESFVGKCAANELNDLVRNPLAGISGIMELELSSEVSEKLIVGHKNNIERVMHLLKQATAGLDHVLYGCSTPTYQTPVVSMELPKGLHVLVADDLPLNTMVLTNKFTRSAPFAHLNWQVTTMRTGEEVLAALDAGNHFDIIVLDTFMEVAGGVITGLETAQIIRERERDTKSKRKLIIGASSHTGPEDCEQSLLAGQDIIWGKPYPDAEQMRRDICIYFNAKTSSPRAP